MNANCIEWLIVLGPLLVAVGGLLVAVLKDRHDREQRRCGD